MGLILHLRIRQFEKDDLPGIMRIERASFHHDAWPRELFLEYCAAEPVLFLVAKVDGRIAGYSIATLALPNRDCKGGATAVRAEIESLAVLPRDRNRGIATALLKATIRKARRSGAGVLSLMVRRNNQSAIQLYRKLGFVRVATIANYYPDGAAAWRMRNTVY
jgi:ribosomal-protein-alanine N-acetyltransferase